MTNGKKPASSGKKLISGKDFYKKSAAGKANIKDIQIPGKKKKFQ